MYLLQWNKFRKLIVVALASCIFSCNHSSDSMAKYGHVVQTVLLSDTSVFRSFSLGATPAEVKKREIATLMESDTSFLYYEMKVDTSVGFNVMYNFDEEGLTELQSDIIVSNREKGDEAFAQFKNYFDDHYGESTNDQGYIVWTAHSIKFGTVRINLSDESADINSSRGAGKLSLWIYVDKDDKN